MQQNGGAPGPGHDVGYMLETHLGRGRLGELWTVCVRDEGSRQGRFVVEFTDGGCRGGWLSAGATFLFAPQPHPEGPQYVGSVSLDGNVQALVGWQQVLCTYAYVLEHCLGRGGFGQVWRAVKSDVGVRVAVKFVFFNPNFLELEVAQYGQSRQVSLLRREILNHSKLGAHPHIVQFYEIIWNPGSVPALVMEYAAGGTLSELLSTRHRTLTHEEAAHYFRQLIAAVQYMHSMNVVNRDIKPCNCLLDETQQVLKMCDFGLSKDTLDTPVKSEVGSFQCKPPEVMEAPAAYDGKLADIWCCGVSLYSLIAGQYPFQRREDEDDTKMKKIVRENRVMRRITADPPDIYRHPGISAAAWDLITRILTRDPAQRLTLAEIRQHPFFQLGTAAHVGPAPADSISSATTDIIIPTQPDALIDQVFKEARPDVPLTASGRLQEEGDFNPSIGSVGMFSLSLDG